jgi:iron complex outermembrane receptor protein
LAVQDPSSAQATEPTSDTQDTADAADEIIVTARRRDERIQDVPVATAVLSRNEIQRAGGSLDRMTSIVPSLQITRDASGSGGSIGLRGISTSVSNAGLEQAVSVVTDGVTISRGRILEQGLFDLQSLQVLKGPCYAA